jgi:hypothetical protein
VKASPCQIILHNGNCNNPQPACTVAGHRIPVCSWPEVVRDHWRRDTSNLTWAATTSFLWSSIQVWCYNLADMSVAVLPLCLISDDMSSCLPLTPWWGQGLLLVLSALLLPPVHPQPQYGDQGQEAACCLDQEIGAAVAGRKVYLAANPGLSDLSKHLLLKQNAGFNKVCRVLKSSLQTARYTCYNESVKRRQ